MKIVENIKCPENDHFMDTIKKKKTIINAFLFYV